MELINKINPFASHKEDNLKKLLIKHDFKEVVNFLEENPEGFSYKMNFKINDISYKLTALDYILVNINNSVYPAKDNAVINIYKYLINNTNLDYAYEHNYHNNDNTFYRITETLKKNPVFFLYLVENKSESLDIDPSVIMQSHYELIDWLIENKDIMFFLLNKKEEIFNFKDLQDRTLYSEVLNKLENFKKEELALLFSHINNDLVNEPYFKNEKAPQMKLIPELLKSLSEGENTEKNKLILDTLFNRSELSLNLDFINKEDLEYYYRTKHNAKNEDSQHIYTSDNLNKEYNI